MSTLELALTIIGSVAASSGFWAFILKKCEKQTSEKDMLLGLGHDRIMYLGMKYIEQQYITVEEYENLYEYLYLPYKAMGGNGSAERIIMEIQKLEVRKK